MSPVKTSRVSERLVGYRGRREVSEWKCVKRGNYTSSVLSGTSQIGLYNTPAAETMVFMVVWS